MGKIFKLTEAQWKRVISENRRNLTEALGISVSHVVPETKRIYQSMLDRVRKNGRRLHDDYLGVDYLSVSYQNKIFGNPLTTPTIKMVGFLGQACSTLLHNIHRQTV